MNGLKRKSGTRSQTGKLPLSLGAVPSAPYTAPTQASSLWLCIYFAQAIADDARLKALADWAYGYSPQIIVESSRALLLEIGASLRLFGGIEALRTRIETVLAGRDIEAAITISPTARGSLWLARCGQTPTLTDTDSLRDALGALPVWVVDESLAYPCAKLGVRTLSALWRLPREGLARRFGRELLRRLDGALGTASDLRHHHAPALRYHVEQDIPDLQDIERLLPSIRVLLKALVEKLELRDQAMERLDIRLFHERRGVTNLSIGLRGSSRDVERLINLIRIRLERVPLPGAVIRIRLEACDVEPFSPVRGGFFSYDAPDRHASLWSETLERLEARLGGQALHRLSEGDDHRPEYAWAREGVADGRAVKSAGPRRMPRRPLWLLPKPERLPQPPDQPASADTLALMSGAERIEGGWWMDKDLRRDYYMARTATGNCLWIYRDLHGGWYLHGYFA